MSRILIIEDEQSIRRVLKKILSEEDSSYEIFESADGLTAMQSIKKDDYDLVLCDIKMPKMDGIEVLQATKKIKPDIPFVMISGHGDLETAVNSMRLGAYDYIAKPPDLNRLLNSVRNALEKKKLVTENNSLRIKVSRKYEMVGNSIPIKTVKSIIDKVSSTEARVLITGSNGTGKELVAHWIHQKSNRRHRPLVEVNCAAIPSELIESELFGHLKGAFTGANKERTGKFEAADGGTLFLDEIGDMSLSAQAKVLRALQENKVQRVGSDKDIKVNVRVLAATNKDLKNEIKGGRFREDLYHRLAVIMIEVPCLNDRREDIPMLIEYFSNKISDDHGDKPKQFSKKAIDMLKGFNWTGNVRELRNVVERLIILGSQPVSVDDVKSFVTKL
ncbi:MAG: response regulator [Flavobacteriaceae bacterium]|nr:response regulator [Flavobacteriaceae bacterium]